MKKILPGLFLICALTTYAQKGILTGNIASHFADNLGVGIGAEITGNGKIVDHTYVGFGVGAMKYSNLSKAYIPFTGKITILPLENADKTIPIIALQGGYAGYSHHSIGGPTFAGHVGFATATKGRARVTFSVGYTSVGLKYQSDYTDAFGNLVTNDKMKYYGGLSVKAGVMLF